MIGLRRALLTFERAGGSAGGGLEYLDRQLISCRGKFGDSFIESFRMIGNGNQGQCSGCSGRYLTTCAAAPPSSLAMWLD